MNEWREIILKHFVAGSARITAVSDADGLLRDPGIFLRIKERGFSLVQFEDSVSFRFDYETRFRPRWEAGEPTELVVVFKPVEHDFETLPADVLAQARRLSFTLKDVFPKLSYGVVSQLETVYFDALYRAQEQYAASAFGDALTRDFILQHVFQIVPNLVTKDSDLLKLLCQKHYTKMAVPEALDQHLINVLRQHPFLQGWPLEVLVRERKSFWEFLDERWPVFVRATRGATALVQEERPGLRYAGPNLLPFDHADIRVFVDNLFEDGLLTPIPWNWDDAAPKTWIRVGLIGEGAENAQLRFEELLKQLSSSCPDGNSQPRDWIGFAQRYSQARLLWTKIGAIPRTQDHHRFTAFCQRANEEFITWLNTSFASIFNYPVVTPLMVHHVPGFVANRLTKHREKKIALVMCDGLAIEQWLLIKEGLKKRSFRGSFREDALFAWVPSITPVSRQAAYSGKVPRYFANSIHRTDCDEAGWRQFWADRGFNSAEAGFLSMSGDVGDHEALDEIDLSRIRVLGITVMKVDKIMHGMQLGSIGMANQVQTWVEEGFIQDLFERLVAAGFDIALTADHGNVEALGIGVPREGVLSDTQGQRCRVYPEAVLHGKALREIQGSLNWKHSGLPPEYHVLLAPYGKAFALKGQRIICHGGASLEEVMVPFAYLECHSPQRQ